MHGTTRSEGRAPHKALKATTDEFPVRGSPWLPMAWRSGTVAVIILPFWTIAAHSDSTLLVGV